MDDLNTLSNSLLKEALSKCCGSVKWVEKMSTLFPVADEETLLKNAASTWYACSEKDWLEAFTHHPRIGDMNSLQEKFPETAGWAEGEQSSIRQSPQQILEALSEANRLYEEKFGYIFIVCATGKSAEEMLLLLLKRLNHQPEEEILIAMEEQQKITALRLGKLLHS